MICGPGSSLDCVGFLIFAVLLLSYIRVYEVKLRINYIIQEFKSLIYGLGSTLKLRLFYPIISDI